MKAIMTLNVKKLFLSPRGRIGRPSFIIGVISLLAFTMLALFSFTKLGPGLTTFYAFIVSFFLFLHIAMCLYGKRLHDLGRTLWPFIGMLALMVIAMIFVGLNFGGIEYFDTVMAHPEYAENEAEMQKALNIYQDTLAKNLPKAGWMMAALPALFTLWLAVAKSSGTGNRYGPAGQT